MTQDGVVLLQVPPLPAGLQPLTTVTRLQQLGLALGTPQQRPAVKQLSMHLCREFSALLR